MDRNVEMLYGAFLKREVRLREKKISYANGPIQVKSECICVGITESGMMKTELIFEQDFDTGYINVISESVSYEREPVFDMVEYIRGKRY